jgi:cardiolipin synthase (CMP-forming)
LVQEEELVVAPTAPQGPPQAEEPRDHSHDVWSVANMITLLRLLLVPVFLVVLLSKRPNADTIAFVIFVVAASTDFLDGLVARSTHTVTELGRTLDPLVDRALIAAAVIGLFLVGRLPLWIALVFVFRDLYLLAGMTYLEREGVKRPAVSWLGKITTAVALTGFALLILGEPMVPGLGIVESPYLPGLGSSPAPFGIYVLYLGVAFSIAAAVQYTFTARRALKAAAGSAP